MLCGSLIDRGRAVSSNGRRIDRNTIEIDTREESRHLIATSAPRRFGINRRVVIAAARSHHNRAEISDVQNDDARAELLRKSNCIL